MGELKKGAERQEIEVKELKSLNVTLKSKLEES